MLYYLKIPFWFIAAFVCLIWDGLHKLSGQVFVVAFAFLWYAFGWKAAIAWWLIVLFDKHSRKG